MTDHAAPTLFAQVDLPGKGPREIPADLDAQGLRDMVANARAAFGKKDPQAIATLVKWMGKRAELLTEAQSDGALRNVEAPSRRVTTGGAHEEAKVLVDNHVSHGTQTFSDTIDGVVRVRFKSVLDACVKALESKPVRLALLSAAKRAGVELRPEPSRILSDLSSALKDACDSGAGWKSALSPEALTQDGFALGANTIRLSALRDAFAALPGDGLPAMESFAVGLLRLACDLACDFVASAREYVKMCEHSTGGGAAHAKARVSAAIRELVESGSTLERRSSHGKFAMLACGKMLGDNFASAADEASRVLLRDHEGTVADFFARQMGGKDVFYKTFAKLGGRGLVRAKALLSVAVPDHANSLSEIVAKNPSLRGVALHPAFEAIRDVVVAPVEQGLKTYRDVRAFLQEHGQDSGIVEAAVDRAG